MHHTAAASTAGVTCKRRMRGRATGKRKAPTTVNRCFSVRLFQPRACQCHILRPCGRVCLSRASGFLGGGPPGREARLRLRRGQRAGADLLDAGPAVAKDDAKLTAPLCLPRPPRPPNPSAASCQPPPNAIRGADVHRKFLAFESGLCSSCSTRRHHSRRQQSPRRVGSAVPAPCSRRVKS